MGKGGARFGSGRPAYRAKAEQLMRVDIREWHRRGLLWDGGRNSWSWSKGGERVGSIYFSVTASTVRLEYSINGADASQTIRRADTDCHYGGTRPWFCCPACQRRVALLYMRGGRFACRKCQRVSYTTQSQSSYDRICSLYHRLADQLEDGKPKWQRWATFNKLEDRFERVSRAVDASLYWRLKELGFLKYLDAKSKTP
jgi:hypothetical protein